MAVLVFINTQKGIIKKAAQEAAYYGAETAKLLGTDCKALVLGSLSSDAGDLGKFGVKEVIHVSDAQLDTFDSQAYTSVIDQVAKQNDANIIVMSYTSTGKTLAGRLAVRMDASSVSGATTLPDTSNGFVIKKGVFSSKAIAHVDLKAENKIISVMGNSLQPVEAAGACSVVSADVTIPAAKVTVIETKTVDGTVPLPEAELVVSAGRGMKGPENWGIIDEMAKILGATTACSRPVADTGWRPHHEHVGQTGVAIRPNLYIAIGISGAIQHLAGVNNSKTIVVINKDPEAPFFKAADYGICADLFDVVPKLNDSLRKFKENN